VLAIAILLVGVGGASLFAQSSRIASDVSSDLARENLSHVAASAAELKAVLLKDAGLLVELKRWVRMKLLSAALGRRDVVQGFCFARSIAKDFNSVLSHDVMQSTIGMAELFADAARSLPTGLQGPEIAMRLDALFTLPDDYLQKVDVSSMAFSLESREPLLDQDVIEWSMKLPLKWKLRRGTNKYLLRKLAYRCVPRHLLDRPKRGFEMPIAEWLRGPLKDWLRAGLYDPKNFEGVPLDQARLIELAEIHDVGERRAHPLLWAALVYLDFVRALRQSSKLAVSA